tara:strand:+ start:171 stop:488 length:318 start_codon:yes stop_codon:yes gene_type:complete
MAAGSINYGVQDGSGNYGGDPVRSVGDHFVVIGGIEADSTARDFQILPTTNVILSASLHNQTDDDTTVRVVINSDDGTEGSDNGSLYVQTSSADDDVHHFAVAYV